MRRRSKPNATKTPNRKRAAIKRHLTPASRHHSGHRPDQSIDQLRRELDEAREQQAATTDVLRIVSASSGEVKPVFEAILNKAVRICNAKFANLSLYDGEAFRAAAFHNVSPEYAEARLRQPWRPHPRSGGAKIVRTKQPVQIDDVRTSSAYHEGDWNVRAIVDIGGARTLLLVPMVKDNVWSKTMYWLV
jgi:two-component system, NtrC family, sensor kinase